MIVSQKLTSDGIVGPFYDGARTHAQPADPVAYFTFRAINSKNLTFALDPERQQFLQDRVNEVFAQSASNDNGALARALSDRVTEDLPLAKAALKEKFGTLYDFELVETEIKTRAEDLHEGIQGQFKCTGRHSHAGDFGTNHDTHAHDAYISFDFKDPQGHAVNIVTDAESAAFLQDFLDEYFEGDHLSMTVEEMGEQIFERVQNSLTQGPQALRNLNLNSLSITMPYDGSLDHPSIPMTFRLSVPEDAPGATL